LKSNRTFDAAASVLARVSFGAALALLPIVVFHLWGTDAAHDVAVTFNLVTYAAMLSLGGYATVMRDVREWIAGKAVRYSPRSYLQLAICQALIAWIIWVPLVAAVVLFVPQVLSINSVASALAALLLGLVLQSGNFLVNYWVGLAYAADRFGSVSALVAASRILPVLVIAILGLAGTSLSAAMAVTAGLATLSLVPVGKIASSLLATYQRENMCGTAQQLRTQVSESSPYFVWSLLSIPVTVAPVTVVAAVEAGHTLGATYAVFTFNALTIFVSAALAPSANRLQDRVGDMASIRPFIRDCLRYGVVPALLWAMLVVFLPAPFKLAMGAEAFDVYRQWIIWLLPAYGLRTFALVTMQLAVALRLERSVVLSQALEALTCFFGFVIAWFLQDVWIVVITLLAAIGVRLFVAVVFEYVSLRRRWTT
jgi:hypothetical protein